MSVFRRRGIIASSGGAPPPPPPPDPFDPANYVNADTQDSTPTSALAIDPVTHEFTLVPNIVLGRHTELGYGFMYEPTAGMTDDVEVVEKVFTGHNSAGTLAATGDQRWNPTFGIGGKITPGSESTGIGLFGALTRNDIEIDFYDYATFGGWFEFVGSGGPFAGGSNTTIEAGNSLLAGTHYFGADVVAHVPMAVHGGASQFNGWDEYNPTALAIDTFLWLVLRLVANRVEFEVWADDPALGGSDFLVKMVTTLTAPAAIALFGSGAPGGVGPGGWWTPPPNSYIESWSYTLL